MPVTQAARRLIASTPLGEDVLLLKTLTIEDQLSQPFTAELELLSEDSDIVLEDLIGQNLRVFLDLPSGEPRYFDGYVCDFWQTHPGREDRLAAYRATVVPWLWFLKKTTDCRIFQDSSVPDIIKTVFRDRGFTDFEDRLSGTYEPQSYCVQYRESDFDFVSRLMEEEGIYYWFQHDEGKHTLVLSDFSESHDPFPGYEVVDFRADDDRNLERFEAIHHWRPRLRLQSGTYQLQDFDYVKPLADLTTRSSIMRQHAVGDLEVFDYPGDYESVGDGERYSRIRIEELAADYEVLEGDGNVLGLSAGCAFELKGHTREDQNRGYLVTSSRLTVHSQTYSSAGELPPADEFQFTCIDRRTAFRPPRITPKPFVHGPQTAIVVGPNGNEIWTDELGRIKVRFHWDRHATSDVDSSCWIRVSQGLAGRGWGAVSIPRVGQEVIVDFLEGDPDRPIVTGRVYNGRAQPPYELPANATVTALKSNSSKGGGGFNEIRIEDLKDEEQIFIHGQKDLDVRIQNDRKELVDNDRHLTVTNDRLEEVGNDQSLIVIGDQIERVDGDVNLTVGGDCKTKIDGGDHSKVTGDINVEAGGDTNLTAGGAHNHKLDGQFSLDAGGDAHAKSGANVAVEAAQNIHIKAGMNVVIEAGAQLTLKVGGNFVCVTQAGVDVKGIVVNVNSGGAAGSGSGCSPGTPAPATAPDAARPPTAPVEAEAGEVSDVEFAPQEKKSYSLESTELQQPQVGESGLQPTALQHPQAKALARAAETGAPFCEKCEEAKQGGGSGKGGAK